MRRDDTEHTGAGYGCVMAFLTLFVTVMLVVLGLAAGPLLVALSGPDLNADVRMVP